MSPRQITFFLHTRVYTAERTDVGIHFAQSTETRVGLIFMTRRENVSVSERQNFRIPNHHPAILRLPSSRHTFRGVAFRDLYRAPRRPRNLLANAGKNDVLLAQSPTIARRGRDNNKWTRVMVMSDSSDLYSRDYPPIITNAQLGSRRSCSLIIRIALLISPWRSDFWY